jgi:hypothetical protein
MRVSLRFDWSWKNTALAWCRQASSTVRRRRTRTRSSRRMDMSACRGPVVPGQLARSQRGQSARTSVVSDARSVVTPTCSLPPPPASATMCVPSNGHALCDGEQVVLVHALVRHVLLVLADPARVHHLAPARVRLRVQQVVAVRAEVQRRLRPVSARRGQRVCAHGPWPREDKEVRVALVWRRAWITALEAGEYAPRRLLGLLAYDRLRTRQRPECNGYRRPAQAESYPCALLCVNSHKPGE